MKDINIVRVKAYIGGCNNRPYVCNELPVSGIPRKDMVRLLKQLKDEENKHIEAIEKQFSDYYGI